MDKWSCFTSSCVGFSLALVSCLDLRLRDESALVLGKFLLQTKDIATEFSPSVSFLSVAASRCDSDKLDSRITAKLVLIVTLK